MVDHVVHSEIRKAQRRMIVDELEGADPRGVSQEGEHHDIAHETHVLSDVLWNSVGRTRDVWLFERGMPSLQFATLSCVLNPLLHFADRV